MEFVWGIDPAVALIAFAFAPVDGGTVEVETVTARTTEREGARLGLLDRKLRIYAISLRARGYEPTCVWIEQPSGRFIKPQSYYVVGVLQAALFEVLACPVWTIPPSTWKKRTVGVGNATKPQVRAWVERLGVPVNSQDQADAVAIACAGRAMLLSGSWEAAA